MPLDTGNFRPLSGQISAPSSSLTCFVGHERNVENFIRNLGEQ